MTYTAHRPVRRAVLPRPDRPVSIPLVRRKGAAHIYAANRSRGKRTDLARLYGADSVIVTGETPVEAIPFRRGGVDRALVSASASAVLEALPVMNYGGIIAFIGIEYGPGAALTFDANELHFRKLQLRASHASPALYFPTCLASRIRINGEAIISHVAPLEHIRGHDPAARPRSEVLKIVIKPTEGGLTAGEGAGTESFIAAAPSPFRVFRLHREQTLKSCIPGSDLPYYLGSLRL